MKDQVVDLLGCERDEILIASGKTGQGVDLILEAICERISPPSGDPNAPLQAMIFDSVFNSFRGIIAYYKILNGTIRKGDKVKFMSNGREYFADEIGSLGLDLIPRTEVKAGDVGYIISGIKTASEVKVGDTITTTVNPCAEAVKGFELLLEPVLKRAVPVAMGVAKFPSGVS